MSFLNPKPDNPVTKYIEWKSDDKYFSYYDKDQKKNIEIPLPIKFIVFDEYSTIKGYNPHSESGIYSNEVSDITRDILNVKAFKSPMLITGLYKDIKDRVNAEGGKFCKSVYAVLFDKENYEIVNFQFRGSSLGTWIEKKFNTDNFSIVVTKFESGKVGKIDYTMPVFEKDIEITGNIRERLLPTAILLSDWLRSKKQVQTETEISEHQEVTDEEIQAEDIVQDHPPILSQEPEGVAEGDLPF